MHFASARFHGENAIIQLIEESEVNIAYRDELYRTARDVSLQATQPENTKEIDQHVVNLATRGLLIRLFEPDAIITIIFQLMLTGDIEALQNLLIDGYDHIMDASDQIVHIAQTRGHVNIAKFLESVPEFEVLRILLLLSLVYKLFLLCIK